MLRSAALAAFLLAITSLDCHAQSPTTGTNSTGAEAELQVDPSLPATYFIIDASGSMKSKDAEAEVTRILTPIQETTPTAPVSRTYFRAATWESCRAVIDIAEPVAAARSVVPTVREFQADFTPLGEALRAAILEAVERGKPANIYLVSDKEQTAGCGVDICTVASALLPVKGIEVHALAAKGTDLAASDRLGCIDAAQGRPRVASTEPPLADDGATAISWLERWAWLIAFALIACSAAAYGLYDANKSVDLANETQEARTLREGVRAGDQEAITLFDERNGKLNKAIEDRRKSWANNWWWRTLGRWICHPKFWSFWLGIVLLIAIAFGTDGETFLGIRIGEAQRAAWEVLNTEFATAFAVLWLATVFFMTSQSQRKREAARNLSIVMEEAERVQEAVDAEDRQRAFSKYEPELQAVESLRYPRPQLHIGSDGDVSQEDTASLEAEANANFELVHKRAISLAVSKKFTVKEKPEINNGETLVLRRLLRSKQGGFYWQRRSDFGVFIENMLTEGRITAHQAEWRAVAEAYAVDDAMLIHANIAALAKKLGSTDAPAG